MSPPMSDFQLVKLETNFVAVNIKHGKLCRNKLVLYLIKPITHTLQYLLVNAFL